MRRVALAVLALSAPGGTALAEDLPLCAVEAPKGAWLFTIDPGSNPETMFGHVTLWVRDPAKKVDHTFHYGQIVMEPPAKMIKDFLNTTQDFMLVTKAPRYAFGRYEKHGRGARGYRLDLPEAWVDQLIDSLSVNRRPENQVFRYHGYTDNCSTKVRDQLDLATQGQLRSQLVGAESGTTVRQGSLRVASSRSTLAVLGIGGGCGAACDQPIDRWDAAYLPDDLHWIVRDSTITWPDGTEHQLGVDECRLLPSKLAPIPSSEPNHAPWLWLLGLGWAGAIAGAGAAGPRLGRAAVALFSLYAAPLGTAIFVFWWFGVFAPFYGVQSLGFTSPLVWMLLPAAAAASRWPEAARATAAVLLTGFAASCALWVLRLGSDGNFGLMGAFGPGLVASAWVLTRRPEAS